MKQIREEPNAYRVPIRFIIELDARNERHAAMIVQGKLLPELRPAIDKVLSRMDIIGIEARVLTHRTVQVITETVSSMTKF